MSEEKTKQVSEAFYMQSEETVLNKMETTMEGLSEQEAKKRIEEFGANSLAEGKRNRYFSNF